MPSHKHWVKLPGETEQKLMTCNIPEGACMLGEGSPEEIGFWFDQKIPGSSFTEWATEFRRRKALVEKIKADPKLIEELDRAAGIPTDADKIRFHASDPVMKREVLLFGEINGVRRLIGKATIEQDFSNTVNPTPVVVVELADGSPLGAFLGPSLSNPSKNGLRLVKAKVDEEVTKNMNDAMDAIVDFAREHKLTPEQVKDQLDKLGY